MGKQLIICATYSWSPRLAADCTAPYTGPVEQAQAKARAMGRRVARLATTGHDQRPHLVPVASGHAPAAFSCCATEISGSKIAKTLVIEQVFD